VADRTRRGVLAAAASLPLLAVSGCKGVGALGPPPKPGPGVGVLRAAIAAEEIMIAQYVTALARFPGLTRMLTELRGEHRLHLAELRTRLVIPPGSPYRTSFAAPPASGTPSPGPSGSPGSPGAAGGMPAGQAAALEFLRSAEAGASAALLRGLPAVSPSLAQLLASVAASESTHVAVLRSAAG
jgi:hypothetical protein